MAKGESAWERAVIIIGELYALGVRRFVYASGARNSPLIASLFLYERRHALREARGEDGQARPVGSALQDADSSVDIGSSANTKVSTNTRFVVRKHFDERGAGFYALGMIRSSGAPAAVVVTSGSALANVMPAVTEASKSELPLIVLSGDRPRELHGRRANQTLRQEDFFGSHAVFSETLSLESDHKTLAKTLREGVYAAMGQGVVTGGSTREVSSSSTAQPLLGGVAHFNIPFRKPLLGEWSEEVLSRVDAQVNARTTIAGIAPIVPIAPMDRISNVDEEENGEEDVGLSELAGEIFQATRAGKNGLIILGILDAMSLKEKHALLTLVDEISAIFHLPITSELYGDPHTNLYPTQPKGEWIAYFPLLAEVLNRAGTHAGQGGRATVDGSRVEGEEAEAVAISIARGRSGVEAVETVLHIGGEIVHTGVLELLKKNPPQHYLHIERLVGHYDPVRLLEENEGIRYKKFSGDFHRLEAMLMHVKALGQRLEQTMEETMGQRLEQTLGKIESSPQARRAQTSENQTPENIPANTSAWSRDLKAMAASIGASVSDSIGGSVSDSVGGSVSASVGGSVSDSVGGSVAASLAPSPSPSAEGNATPSLPSTPSAPSLSKSKNSPASPKSSQEPLRKELTELAVMETLRQCSIASFKQAGNRHDWSLFLGNSMPVRSWTLTTGGGQHGFADVFVSRGTSGIDGLIAMATGLADELCSENQCMLAVVGDLTLLHDLNSLALLKTAPATLGILVLNNHEGSIFRHLPLRQYMPKERWDDFAFSHNFSFGAAAAFVGLAYECVSAEDALAKSLLRMFSDKKSFLLEVSLQGEASHKAYQALIDARL